MRDRLRGQQVGASCQFAGGYAVCFRQHAQRTPLGFVDAVLAQHRAKLQYDGLVRAQQQHG
jgi:hypothetical protein